jgi:hypothetical protein
MTSFLPFLPRSIQLPTGMIIVTLYLFLILLYLPYYRKSDDLLHGVAQVELMLLCLAGLSVYPSFFLSFP